MRGIALQMPLQRARFCPFTAWLFDGGSVPAAVVALVFHDKSGSARRTVQIDHLVVAGWTGRDKAAVEKHIAELEAIGVKRPASTPIFYRASAARITTDDAIEALGNASSGEA